MGGIREVGRGVEGDGGGGGGNFRILWDQGVELVIMHTMTDIMAHSGVGVCAKENKILELKRVCCLLELCDLFFF